MDDILSDSYMSTGKHTSKYMYEISTVTVVSTVSWSKKLWRKVMQNKQYFQWCPRLQFRFNPIITVPCYLSWTDGVPPTSFKWIWGAHEGLMYSPIDPLSWEEAVHIVALQGVAFSRYNPQTGHPLSISVHFFDHCKRVIRNTTASVGTPKKFMSTLILASMYNSFSCFSIFFDFRAISASCWYISAHEQCFLHRWLVYAFYINCLSSVTTFKHDSMTTGTLFPFK
jgi:hypothetical protein